MELLSIEYGLATIFNYRLSLIGLVGCISGLASVYFAAKTNILTWPLGLINEAALFALFYQVQLYSDMALQLFFAAITVYGWQYWRLQNTMRPTILTNKARLRYSLTIVSGSIFLGVVFSQINQYLPNLFPLPAAYPYLDGLTASTSIIATLLMIKRTVESWFLWIAIDLISVALYIERGIFFMAFLYCIFFCLASYGLRQWTYEYVRH